MNLHRASQKQTISSRPVWIYAVISILIVATVYFGGLLSTPTLCYGCGRPIQPVTNSIHFGSSGWVTLNITNPRGSDVPNFAIAKVIGQVNPTNYNYSVTIYLSSLYVIPEGVTAPLSIQFQGVTWQTGARYVFTIVSSEGDKFPTFGCPSGCN